MWRHWASLRSLSSFKRGTRPCPGSCFSEFLNTEEIEPSACPNLLAITLFTSVISLFSSQMFPEMERWIACHSATPIQRKCETWNNTSPPPKTSKTFYKPSAIQKPTKCWYLHLKNNFLYQRNMHHICQTAFTNIALLGSQKKRRQSVH